MPPHTCYNKAICAYIAEYNYGSDYGYHVSLTVIFSGFGAEGICPKCPNFFHGLWRVAEESNPIPFPRTWFSRPVAGPTPLHYHPLFILWLRQFPVRELPATFPVAVQLRHWSSKCLCCATCWKFLHWLKSLCIPHS